MNQPASSSPSPPPDFGPGSPYPTPTPSQVVFLEFPSASPVVAYTLLGITVFVFLLQLVSQSLYGSDLPARLGIKVNILIAHGQIWRLFTPIFLHASIMHIGFNMYALHIFGPGLERHFGHIRFLALYFLAGFAGNVFSMIFSASPSLGSSTAIFGLLGAEGVFLYSNRKFFGDRGKRALGNILTIALINLVIGLSPGIDNWGHLGGLIGGTLFAWLGGPKFEVEGILPRLSVVDRRETREVITAGVAVGALFALLAGMAIYYVVR